MSKHGYGEMKVDPVSGAVLGGKLQQVYVYEAPVRIWHWVMMIAMFVLIPTGYLIGSPWSGPREEASLHLLLRQRPHDPLRRRHGLRGRVCRCALYWAVIGNHHARAIFIPPVWSFSWWKGLFSQAMYYLFLKQGIGARGSATTRSRSSRCSAMYVLGSIVIILTGFALYAEQFGWGSTWMNVFGWVNTLLGSSQMVRTVHHFAMYYLMIFAIVHMYMVFREDIMSQQSVVGTMISGVRTFKAGAKIEKV